MLCDFTLFTLIAVDNKEKYIVLSCSSMDIIITLMEVIRKYRTIMTQLFTALIVSCFIVVTYIATYTRISYG